MIKDNEDVNNKTSEQSFFKDKYESLKTVEEKDENDTTHKMITTDLPSEDIFIFQKEEIKKIKKKNSILKLNKKKLINCKQNNIKYIKKNVVYNKNYIFNHDIRRTKINVNKINNINSFRITQNINTNINNSNNNSSANNIINNTANILNDDNLNINNIYYRTKTFNHLNINEINPFVNIYKKIDIKNGTKKLILHKNSYSRNQLFYDIENYKNFEISKTIYYYDERDEENNIPIIIQKWKNLDSDMLNSFVKNKSININFKNLALRTKNEINYNENGIQLNINLSLIGESQFWVSTRCYIEDEKVKNNSIPYSFKENNMFNKYSNLIKINKISNSNKAFVSFGAFYESKKTGKIYYKTFLKRQLINFKNNEDNYYYLENDLCEFNIILTDLGSEILEAKISLNNKNEFNNIKGNFYLPFNKNAKMAFFGSGDNVIVTGIKIKNIKIGEDEDLENDNILTSKKQNCDCCITF